MNRVHIYVPEFGRSWHNSYRGPRGGRSSRPFLSSDASCLPRGKLTIDEAIERVGAPAISDYSYEPCRGGAAGYWGWQRTLSSSFTALPILSIKSSCR